MREKIRVKNLRWRSHRGFFTRIFHEDFWYYRRLGVPPKIKKIKFGLNIGEKDKYNLKAVYYMS